MSLKILLTDIYKFHLKEKSTYYSEITILLFTFVQFIEILQHTVSSTSIVIMTTITLITSITTTRLLVMFTNHIIIIAAIIYHSIETLH